MKYQWFIISAVLLSLSVAGCIQPMAVPAAQATTSVAALEAANKAVVQRFYAEVFTQKKMAVLGEIFAKNFVVHDLDVGGELLGGGLPETLAAFPDVKATINQWVVEGDLVVAYTTYNGTHQGEFLGVAPTGKAVTWSIIDIFRVKDSKITELWHNVPNEDILEQIQPAAK
jgi:predicted ester cyclase